MEIDPNPFRLLGASLPLTATIGTAKELWGSRGRASVRERSRHSTSEPRIRPTGVDNLSRKPLRLHLRSDDRAASTQVRRLTVLGLLSVPNVQADAGVHGSSITTAIGRYRTVGRPRSRPTAGIEGPWPDRPLERHHALSSPSPITQLPIVHTLLVYGPAWRLVTTTLSRRTCLTSMLSWWA